MRQCLLYLKQRATRLDGVCDLTAQKDSNLGCRPTDRARYVGRQILVRERRGKVGWAAEPDRKLLVVERERITAELALVDGVEAGASETSASGALASSPSGDSS
jgi:hypothetical protein